MLKIKRELLATGYAFRYSVMVLRVGDAWLVGVGKRAPHGLPDRLKSLCIISLYRILKDRHIRAAG